MRSGKAPDSRARHLAEQKNIVMVNLFLLTGRCMQIVDRYDQRLRLMIKINFHTLYWNLILKKKPESKWNIVTHNSLTTLMKNVKTDFPHIWMIIIDILTNPKLGLMLEISLLCVVFPDLMDVGLASLHVSVIFFCAVLIVFSSVSCGFFFYNAFGSPYETLHGPQGLYLWNMISCKTCSSTHTHTHTSLDTVAPAVPIVQWTINNKLFFLLRNL